MTQQEKSARRAAIAYLEANGPDKAFAIVKLWSIVGCLDLNGRGLYILPEGCTTDCDHAAKLWAAIEEK